MQALSQLSYTPKTSLAYTKEKPLHIKDLQGFLTGGVDGTRTRDPRRDRPVF
jgi:hypothetical protein